MKIEATSEEITALVVALQGRRGSVMSVGQSAGKCRMFPLAKEVLETADAKECALLLQNGEWIVHNALFQGDKIVWCLLRI